MDSIVTASRHNRVPVLALLCASAVSEIGSTLTLIALPGSCCRPLAAPRELA